MIEKDLLSQEEIAALLKPYPLAEDDHIASRKKKTNYNYETSKSKTVKLTDVELTLRASVAKIITTLEKVMSWQKNDFIAIKIANMISIEVNGIPTFIASFYDCPRYRAVKILKNIAYEKGIKVDKTQIDDTWETYRTLLMSKRRTIKSTLDIPILVTVELGRTKMSVSKIQQLSIGAIIPLNTLNDDPFNIVINDVAVARAKVAQNNQQTGVQLVHIVSEAKRIKQLK